MKLKNKVLLSLGSVGAVAAATVAVGFAKEVMAAKTVIPPYFSITAHTGCEGTKPNSLDSITVGYVSGANIVEFDLSFDSDGVAVLSHDTPVGTEFTLDEAFSHLEQFSSLLINVDVKDTSDLAQVVSCAEKHGLKERIFFTGIFAEDVERVVADAPGIPFYLNVAVPAGKQNDSGYISTLIEEIKSLGAVGINFRYTSCSKLLTDMFHEQGLLVSIWTVNNRFDMRKALSYGADNITTKKPATLLEFVAPALSAQCE